jgi:hypothetical protein
MLRLSDIRNTALPCTSARETQLVTSLPLNNKWLRKVNNNKREVRAPRDTPMIQTKLRKVHQAREVTQIK